MAITVLERPTAAAPRRSHVLDELLTRVEEGLALAAELPTAGLDGEALGRVVASLVRVESRAQA